MEEIYLKELKSFSISERMSFRDKYVELINKLAQEAENEEDDTDEALSLKKKKLCRMSTEKKMRKRNTTLMKEVANHTKKLKPEYKDLPPLLPIVVPEDLRKIKKRKRDLVPHKDVAFVFKVYPPFTYENNTRNYKTKHNMEIVMLGHQTLDQFCDKIVCGESYMEVGGDISETPDIPVRQRLGEKYKSRMLYIGNTFYIDKSDPNNIDYSVNIRKWGERNNLQFGETLDMHENSCLDLVARIGFPYVYQHLGGCEHVFRIEYVRLIEEKDCLESILYPFYTYLSKSNPKLCMACMELSEWIVLDSHRMISNPSYLCNSCFRSYHYIDGKKIGTFRAVRYWDCPVFSSIFDKVCTKFSAPQIKEEIDID